MRCCYGPCSRCSDLESKGKMAWSSWRVGRSPSSGCCCWTRLRTGRPYGELCFGAPAEGAGRSPQVVADTPPAAPGPAET